MRRRVKGEIGTGHIQYNSQKHNLPVSRFQQSLNTLRIEQLGDV